MMATLCGATPPKRLQQEVAMTSRRRKAAIGTAIFALNVIIGLGAISTGHFRQWIKAGLGTSSANAVETAALTPDQGPSNAPSSPQSLELNEKQLASVKVGPVVERDFPVEKTAVGSIDFNEDMTVQVFTPYQGRIISLFAKVGDDVKKGDTLFTIDSPDLLNADSNLIAAAGVLELTTRNLVRLRQLYETRAVAQKDLEQGISDQQTAEGTLRTARDAVRIFGKTDEEIDAIVKERRADPTLIVPSPITGHVTARVAAPGLFVQPGNPPAPYSVADISTMWMLANVAESDVPAFHLGQRVKVSISAYPGKVFEGRISTITSMVDPNTHRMLVRSDINDPNHELRAGMFTTFVIQTGNPVHSLAVPLNGVVREGDGTMTVWATTDRKRFAQRTVKIGLENEGYRQILDGLAPGELVATDGAVFLSNMVLIGENGG
jgi:membrane fusion protein, heavy metal efflux system